MSIIGQEKIYSIVTDRIIEELKKGTIPWKKPWDSSFHLPVNLKSNKSYRGSNILMLLCSGFSSKYWLTYKQAKELGGTVKSGEQGTIITFWNFPLKEEGNEDSQKRAFLRYYTVFNLTQCEGITSPKEENSHLSSFTNLSLAEGTVKNYPSPSPTILAGVNAGYSDSKDIILMPPIESFSSVEEYYSTLFHELAHSTGHHTRLKRDLSNYSKESASYSIEELIAELASAFLCASAKISNEVVNNQAAYIAGWIKALKNDNKILVKAGGKAQLAADYILNNSIEERIQS